MEGPVLIVLLGFASSVAAFMVARRYRGGLVPVSWYSYASIGFYSLLIALLYLEIIYVDISDVPRGFLVQWLRLLIMLVLLVNLVMSIGVLSMKGYGNGDE